MRPLLLALPLAALLAAAPAAAQAPAGRLAEASGPVALRPVGGTWSPAPRGAALLEGQTLRTGPRAQAELDLGPNRLGLDPDTVLRIDSAHPGMPAFTLEQGRAMILLRSLRPGQVGRVHLPGGSVSLAEPGLYVVSASEPGRPGAVGVSRGLAQVFGPGVSLAVPQGQTGLFGGAQPASLRQGVAEGFLADDPTPPPPQLVHPTAPPPPPAPPPPDLAAIPGADPLRQQGNWADLPDYGTVWYPPVPAGWNPYVDPWHADRWGHVPYSSGAWIMIGPRWAWMPPRRVPPPAWRHAHPPPAHGHRPPPVTAPPPVAAPAPPVPFPAAPHVVAPRPMPPAATLPPAAFVPAAPVTLPTGQPRPPLAAPAPPLPGPPPIAAPRPNLPATLPPPVATAPPAAPHVFAPRPAPAPAALPPPMPAPRIAPPPAIAPPMAAPPIAAPPLRPAPPPPRSCPPGRTIC